MKKVLIIIDTSRLTGRELLSGAERYISAFAEWQVHTLSPNYLTKNTSRPRNPDIENFDGFFVCYTKDIMEILKTKKPKIIHHTPDEIISDGSLIVTNSSKIGKTAAEYFLSLGFKNYAYCGFENISWSNNRYLSYKKTLEKHGADTIECFCDRPSQNNHVSQKRLAKWLKKLPKPVAIFACNDDRAIYILEACKNHHINIPEEIAVLGVDNDSLICNLSSPPLSSMSLNFENVGYTAARHLDKLMNRKVTDKIFKVDPVEIVTRNSTDILAIEDKDLIWALQYIRKNFDKPIQVSNVVKATSISRRKLEYRFKEILKKTIKDEIERLRIEYIKKKLISSREPIYKIVETLEFTDSEHFSRYFKNQTGISPSMFRQNINPGP